MNVKKNKLRATLIAVVVILSISIASGAYFVSKETKENKFKVANYKIDTKEDFEPKDNWKTEMIKKEVWAENNGTLPAYIRIKIVPFWKSGLPTQFNDKSTVELEFSNSNLWKKIGDYYYYKKVVNPGEKTEDLITGVKVNGELIDSNKDYNIKDLSVDVFTDSIIHLDDSSNEKNKETNNDRLKSTWKVQESDIF